MTKLIDPTARILPKEKTVAFTGYRASKLSNYLEPNTTDTINTCLRHRLDVVIRYLYYEEGYRNFIQGMQSGLDLNAALSVSEIRENGCKDIKLYGAIPCVGFTPEVAWINIYNSIRKECDEIYFVGYSATRENYLGRNDFMINNASTVVCYYDGRGGGTGHTFHKAEDEGLPIHNLCNTFTGIGYGNSHPCDLLDIMLQMEPYITPPNILRHYLLDNTI